MELKSDSDLHKSESPGEHEPLNGGIFEGSTEDISENPEKSDSNDIDLKDQGGGTLKEDAIEVVKDVAESSTPIAGPILDTADISVIQGETQDLAESAPEDELAKFDTPAITDDVTQELLEEESQSLQELNQGEIVDESEAKPITMELPQESVGDIIQSIDQPSEDDNLPDLDTPPEIPEAPQDISEEFPSEVETSPDHQADISGDEITESPESTDLVGDPEGDEIGYHEQESPNTCVQASVEGIVHKQRPETVESVSEESLASDAYNDGAYHPDYGTYPSYIKTSLENQGVPAQEWRDASVNDVESELGMGHDIIAAVDAGILWDDIRYMGSGHAVRITGLEKDGTAVVQFIRLRDSGNIDIDGSGRVPIARFKRAWRERGNFMVSTRYSASEMKARISS